LTKTAQILTFLRIKKELDVEIAEHKIVQNQAIKDKENVMSLEVKVSALESQNMTKDLELKDAKMKNQELELMVKNITSNNSNIQNMNTDEKLAHIAQSL
jgi:hypothetical protein